MNTFRRLIAAVDPEDLAGAIHTAVTAGNAGEVAAGVVGICWALLIAAHEAFPRQT